MKKILIILVALLVLLPVGVSFAWQIDEGQNVNQEKEAFFVARCVNSGYGSNVGNLISKDKVVIFDDTSDDGVTVTYPANSNDAIVAGVTMEAFNCYSEDSTAANDPLSNNNWGRIQTYGVVTVSRDWSAAPSEVGSGYYTGQHPGSVSTYGTKASLSADAKVGAALDVDASTDTTAQIFLKLN